jgi:hypothetical protein
MSTTAPEEEPSSLMIAVENVLRATAECDRVAEIEPRDKIAEKAAFIPLIESLYDLDEVAGPLLHSAGRINAPRMLNNDPRNARIAALEEQLRLAQVVEAAAEAYLHAQRRWFDAEVAFSELHPSGGLRELVEGSRDAWSEVERTQEALRVALAARKDTDGHGK